MELILRRLEQHLEIVMSSFACFSLSLFTFPVVIVFCSSSVSDKVNTFPFMILSEINFRNCIKQIFIYKK